MPKKQISDIQFSHNICINLIVILTIISTISVSLCIKPHLRSSAQSINRSDILQLVITQENNIQRADYYDQYGKITFASDKQYASRIRTTENKSVVEEYFDENGKPSKQKSGHFAALYEYDEEGHIIKISYLGNKHEPVYISSGYSIIKYEYNGNGKIEIESYYDIDGKPVKTKSFGNECHREYDENGNNIKTVYMDETGKPIVTAQGFSIRKMSYYDDGISKGKIKCDFFYDNNDRPIKSATGQFGTYYEYDQYGRVKKKISIDQYGKPMINSYGYCSVNYTYYYDDTVESEKYYDTNGNPVQLSEGQYGIKHIEEKTILLDKQGKEKINLKILLYNSDWIVIISALMLIIISSLVEKKTNKIFLVVYLCFVLYMTIYRKNNVGLEQTITALRSYRYFFSDAAVRRGIVFNILLFMPIGSILYRIVPFKILVIILAVISVTIEAIQYFAIIGECALDDVISNVCGGIIGYIFSKCINNIKTEVCGTYTIN